MPLRDVLTLRGLQAWDVGAFMNARERTPGLLRRAGIIRRQASAAFSSYCSNQV